MDNQVLGYNSLQEFSEVLGIYDATPPAIIEYDDDDFGLPVHQRGTQASLNSMLTNTGFNLFKKAILGEYRVSRSDADSDAIRVMLNPVVLDILESAHALIKKPRRGTRYSPNIHSKIFNAISNILHTNTTINNKVIALIVFSDMLRKEGFYFATDFLPDFVDAVNSNKKFAKFAVCDLKVGDFKASKMTMAKKTEFPTIYSTLENLTLLEDEIEKIEKGLYVKIENVIDKLLASADYAEFIDQALIFYSIVDPFTVSETDTGTDISSPWISSRDRGSNKPKSDPTLTEKFKLDCACHTQSSQWKLMVLPTIINQVFAMIAK